MKNRKHKAAIGLMVTAVIFAVVAAILFIVAPILEDLMGGWTYEYDGYTWGLYQYGYAPAGLIYNLIHGVTSLIQPAVVLEYPGYDPIGIINIRAIVADVILVVYFILFLVVIIKTAKRKARRAGIIIFSFLGFLISTVVVAAMATSINYFDPSGAYSYLVDSIFLNNAVLAQDRWMAVIAVFVGMGAQFLILISLIVEAASLKKQRKPVEQAVPISEPQPVPKAQPAHPQGSGQVVKKHAASNAAAQPK